MPFVDRRSFAVRAVRTRGGPIPLRLSRLAFWPLSCFYRVGLAVRSAFYALGLLRKRRLGVPVISVGNLTAGGTGKTPMVEWLAAWLRDHGRSPVVLSRGYGADDRYQANDEAKLLERNTPGLLHVIDPDRVHGGRRAVEELGADCLVLDDGFQHIRLERDLDVVLIDALDPFGGGRLLPAGALREPLGALSRAHVLAVTRANLVESDTLTALTTRLRDEAPDAAVLEVGCEPTGLDALDDGASQQPSSLEGKRVFGFCGLGNPAAFVRSVESLRPASLDGVMLDDHTPYSPETVGALAEEAVRVKAEVAVTTQKDAVKIEGRWPGPLPLLALRVRIRIMSGEDAFTGLLHDALQPRSSRG